jgi:malate permease and related proteins
MIDNLYRVLHIVSPAFILIALGFLYNKIAKADVGIIVRACMGLLVPAFAFYHILVMKVPATMMSSMFISAWIIILGNGALTLFLMRSFKINRPGLLLPVMFMNTVNLPFPILVSAYGEQAISLSIMFYFASLIGAFTVGILIVSPRDAGIQIFKEPVIYVLVLGLYIKYNGVHVSDYIMAPLKMLESATIPMVLLALGMQMSQVRISEFKLALFGTLCRFAGGLALGWACVYGFGLQGLARKVVLFNSIMPSAVIGFLIAQKYDKDGSLAASIVLLTTVLSIVLIPLMLVWLG